MIRTTDAPALPAGEWFPSEIPLVDNRLAAVRTALARYKELPGERTEAFLAFLREATGQRHDGTGAASLSMTWDMIREMQTGGITIGAHTVNHQLLRRLSEPEQER